MISVTDEIDNKNKQTEKIVKNELIRDVKELIFKGHRKIVQDHNDKLEEKKVEKERLEKVSKFLIERNKLRKKTKEKSTKKMKGKKGETTVLEVSSFIFTFLERIEETNIATKNVKHDIISLNLADIDEFSLKNENGTY